MKCMKRSEIFRTLMPERTKQVALAWSILRESQSAEDAYQDMLTKVLENENGFEGPRHLRDWAWKVLRNRCYELVRKQKYQVKLLDESILDLVDTELEGRDTQDFPQRVDALRLCIEGLSEKSRNTIKLRYFEGLRGIQVAERMGRKPDAVYKALQRIHTTLSECIQKKLTGIEPGESIS